MHTDELVLPDDDSWASQYCPRPAVHSTRARARASELLAAQAPITAREQIRTSASGYARKPRTLDAIAEGLFNLPPRDLVRTLRRLIAIMNMSPARLLGTDGGVLAINLQGAMLYARYNRAKAHRISMKRWGMP